MPMPDEVEVLDSYDAIYEFSLKEGWSDGLPIVPPTVERVNTMLAWTDRDADEIVGYIPPLNGEASIRRIAANAVMAGCRPEYLPVVITAVEALLDKGFNLDAVQTTTGPVTTLAIVNGPIARELGINAGTNAFGPGWRSNATIGRAVRLILVNIGGARPGETNQRTQGQPGMFTFCAAENEARSPWEPFHVEHGMTREKSTVAVFAVGASLDIYEGENATDILTTAAHQSQAMMSKLCNGGECLIALCPEQAQVVASGGFSKQQAREFLWKHTGVPLSNLMPYYRQIVRKRRPHLFEKGGGDSTWIPVVDHPDRLHLIVIGGESRHSSFFACFAYSRVALKCITNRQGEAVRSVADLRRSS
ncbi:MAG: hypothetical protein HYX87_09700 [Chloroflexi bacterium]|nr:hypothetical protein [Chloroflexota bacterium]